MNISVNKSLPAIRRAVGRFAAVRARSWQPERVAGGLALRFAIPASRGPGRWSLGDVAAGQSGGE